MSPRLQNRKSFAMLLAIAVGMCGAAYASVPFYDWFCRVTGFGGATIIGDEASIDDVLERRIKIRFDASLERGMPWEFRPEEREVELQIGESALAFYVASNPTNRSITGSASYNVHPFRAGGHFVKIDCFCFQEQTLGPGETVRMPVQFYVDPDIVDDPEVRDIKVITLSYTFHVAERETADTRTVEFNVPRLARTPDRGLSSPSDGGMRGRSQDFGAGLIPGIEARPPTTIVSALKFDGRAAMSRESLLNAGAGPVITSANGMIGPLTGQPGVKGEEN